MLTEILMQKGLILSLEEGRLAVKPKEKLNDDLRFFIRQNKKAIINELSLNNFTNYCPVSNGNENEHREEHKSVMMSDELPKHTVNATMRNETLVQDEILNLSKETVDIINGRAKEFDQISRENANKFIWCEASLF